MIRDLKRGQSEKQLQTGISPGWEDQGKQGNPKPGRYGNRDGSGESDDSSNSQHNGAQTQT